MSMFRDALDAIKSIILIEERVRQQSGKVEKLADIVVDLDRRLVRMEAMMEIALRSAPPPGGKSGPDPRLLDG